MLMSLYLWFMCVIPATYTSSLYVYVSRVYICLSVVSLYLIACYAPGWPSTALLPALVIITKCFNHCNNMLLALPVDMPHVQAMAKGRTLRHSPSAIPAFAG